MKIQEILPVILSVLVIILVAVLEKQSRLFAAITATMPLTVPLALWIVYSSSGGERAAVADFGLNLVLGLVATFAFAIAVWLAARTGMKLVPILLTGYGVWGAVTVILLAVRNLSGMK
jgi:hypothetical protein